MPALQRRRNADGSTSTTAIVRLRGFQATSKTFKADTQSEADSLADAWARDCEKGLKSMRQTGSGAREVTRIVIRDLCLKYLADPDTKLLKDVDGRAAQLAWWGNAYGDMKCAAFGTARLYEARNELINGGKHGHRAPATVNRHLASLRSAFAWGKRSGLIGQNFSWPTRLMLKEPRAKVVTLDVDQYKILLAEALKESPEFVVPFVLCLSTGARRGEAEQAKWGDIDLERATWSIQNNKGELPRGNFLPPFAVELLRPYASDKKPGDRVMPYSRTFIEKRWRKLRARAGLPELKWHGTRHAFASVLVMNGATLYEAQHALGHRSATSTQRYAHLVNARPTIGHAGFELMFKTDEKKP
jgi:integrase